LEPPVRKWAFLAIAVAGVACSRGPSMGSSLTGAASAREAATMFMGAVKSQDLMAMGTVWGNATGASRDYMERSEHERRLVILQQCYDHDRFQVLEESVSADGNRTVRVQITRGNLTKVPAFKVVRGPSNRWYIEDTDYEAVRADFCTRST
jgi:hypothetical protein